MRLSGKAPYLSLQAHQFVFAKDVWRYNPILSMVNKRHCLSCFQRFKQSFISKHLFLHWLIEC
nr:MAG TPA: hypothetical protein [Caudoviricetes sp.]